jgi:thiamine kinase-like enzyme
VRGSQSGAEAARVELKRVLDDPEEASRAVLTPLVGGTHRRSWLVAFADRRCVLRTPVPGSQALLDIATEARAMNAAARVGVAPPVLATAANGTLLTDYKPGSPWTSSDARHPKNVERLAAILRTLHSVAMDLPAFAAERIASAYLAAPAATEAAARHAHATRWGDELLTLARHYDRRYRPTTFCHNDLVSANVIDDGSLALVDFEYAVCADPLLDLASLAGMNGFNRTEQRALLAAYRRVAPAAAEIAELASLVRLVRLMAWFWALLGEANAADSTPYSQYLAKFSADLRQD